MSDSSSVNSFYERDSTDSDDEPSSGTPARINNPVGNIIHESSVSSTALREEQGKVVTRSFDEYDKESERFDDDINVSLTADEKRLMREIEAEEKVDDELGRDLTRAALLTSPLLMAASYEVVKSGTTSSSLFFPKEAPTHDALRGTYSAIDPGGDDNSSDSDSDLDGEINEDDFVFRRRSKTSDQGYTGTGQANPHDVGSSLAPPTIRYENYRRIMYIGGWVVAVALIVTLVVSIGIRQTSKSRASAPTMAPFGFPSISPRPSVTPSRSSQPTETPIPTDSTTTRPTVSPTRLPRTRSPTKEPSAITLKPIAAPTSLPRTRSPSREPTAITQEPISLTLTPTVTSIRPVTSPTTNPTPFQFPLTTQPTSQPFPSPTTLSPTSQPSALTLEPSLLRTIAPTIPSSTQKPTERSLQPSRLRTISPISTRPIALPSQPVPLPTRAPNQISSIFPSGTSEDAQRRADIIALFISISGVLVLLDKNSPQFKALQWILNDDPLVLMANDTPEIIQRYTLGTLFFATNGNTSWLTCGPPTGTTPCSSELRRFLSGAPECVWLGVTCDADRKITGVNIRGNGLDGELPAELGELTRLSSLSFGGNSLYGTIPEKLRWLKRLQFLLLNGNQYTGTIPTYLGEFGVISYLHLGNNRFTGTIPPAIFTQSLQHIDLGQNQLIGTIPSEMFNVAANLQDIDISNNKISGSIPTGLGDLMLLRTFSALNNTLTGALPGEIISDTLATLNVGTNQLEGTLPPEIYMFGSSLTFLNLGPNKFEGTISPRYGEMVRLQTLVFFFNGLTGTIPSELGQLTSLGVLHLAATKVQGTMPSEICDLIQLNLRTLTSDCSGSSPAVECSCCTFCY